MGLGGISIWQLLIILVIVLLLFGTKKLRGIGGDLGGAVKGFKDSMNKDGEENTDAEEQAEESAALNKNAESSEDPASEKEKEANS
ncbi:UNVERIFIED_CONTAM: hypothetical protein GTU68_059373 [Idotea baltica]|nr:hypothetical protein [Idotea baltica]